MIQKNDLVEKAYGVLIAGALGDALGMPTQMISRTEAAKAYGEVCDFVAPTDWHPVSRGLVAATITDDTEQTMLLCDRIIEAPDKFDERAWAGDLIKWEDSVRARGLHDLLGPSTKRALEVLIGGASPDQTGRQGNTNGAAMRASPIGISTPIEPMVEFVDRLEETCRITHNTNVAISAAAAVAAAVSAGLDGAGINDALSLALAAAREGATRGYATDAPPIVDRIEFALGLLASPGASTEWNAVADSIGTSSLSHESVPLAFAIFKATAGNAWDAAVISANVGGDTDTIGAIAASMAAAIGGTSALPSERVSIVEEVNQLDLGTRARALIDIRLNRSAHKATVE